MTALASQWQTSLPVLLGDLVADVVPDLPVSGLALNSHDVRAGSLFLALRGIQRHGLEFASRALAAGAVAIAWEPDGSQAPPADASVPVIAVKQLSQHCGLIASRFFDHPSRAMHVAGVTGTNGKTTVVHLLARAGRRLGLCVGQNGTLGFGLGDHLTPSTLTTPDVVSVHKRLAWLREQGATEVAMEVSSHALDQGRVNGVRFDVAVFTNLSRDHLDYHPTLADYGAAKQRLFRCQGLVRAVLNMGDDYAQEITAQLREDVAITRVYPAETARPAGTAGDHLAITRVVTTDQGLRVRFTSHAGDGQIESSLLGAFNAVNLLQALAVLLHWQADLEQACVALGAVRPPPGRMESFGGGARPLVVVDYAHTPDALASALAALRAHCQGRLWCVFGCGGDRDRGKRPQMAGAAVAADRVIVTDDNPRHEDPERIVADILAGFAGGDQSVRVERNRRAAIELACSEAEPGDVILVAGKGHEAWQVVGSQRLPLSDREIVADLCVEAA